jgi:hypothetical protein
MLEGLARFDLINLFRTGHAILRMVFIVLALHFDAGIVGIAAAELTARVFLHAWRWIAIYRIDPALVPWPRRHAAELRTLLGFGAWSGLRNAAEVAAARLYEPMVAALAGVPAVGAFYAGRRLASTSAEVVVPMAGVLVPLSSEMEASGRQSALRQTLLSSTKIAVVVGPADRAAPGDRRASHPVELARGARARGGAGPGGLLGGLPADGGDDALGGDAAGVGPDSPAGRGGGLADRDHDRPGDPADQGPGAGRARPGGLGGGDDRTGGGTHPHRGPRLRAGRRGPAAPGGAAPGPGGGPGGCDPAASAPRGHGRAGRPGGMGVRGGSGFTLSFYGGSGSTARRGPCSGRTSTA